MSRKEFADNIIALLKENPNNVSKITEILFEILLTVPKEKLNKIIEALRISE